MKTSEKLQKAFEYFKKSYKYSMGGSQTIILPNGKSQYFDDKKYYEGRGSKYNNSIKHDEIGIVKVSKKEYSEFLKMLKAQKENQAIALEKRKKYLKRIEEAKRQGVYFMDGEFIELSDDEHYKKHFDAERLAKTLDINIKDANLLKSRGKTYVFAKQMSSDKTLELYHADLSCNGLNIHVSYPSEERIKEFNHNEWINAPYANEVGQTESKNHFVC